MKKTYFLLFTSLLLFSASDKNKPKAFTQNTTLSYTEFAAPVTITLKGYMVDGFMEGECRGYLQQDLSKLLVIGHYKHSKLDGQYIQYYPNGRIYEVGIAQMDSMLSSTLYDSSGYDYISYIKYKGSLIQIHGNESGNGLHMDVWNGDSFSFDTVSKSFVKDHW